MNVSTDGNADPLAAGRRVRRRLCRAGRDARPADRRRTQHVLARRLGVRVARFLVDVVCQRRTIAERPVAGLAHALVFWGFVAFGGYTTRRVPARPRHRRSHRDRAGSQPTGWSLTPFAVAVLAGIGYLLVRRARRPAGRARRPRVDRIDRDRAASSRR